MMTNLPENYSLTATVIQVGDEKYFRWDHCKERVLMSNILYPFIGGVGWPKFTITNPSGEVISTGAIQNVGTHASYEAWVEDTKYIGPTLFEAKDFVCGSTITVYVNRLKFEEYCTKSKDKDEYMYELKWKRRMWRNMCGLSS